MFPSIEERHTVLQKPNSFIGLTIYNFSSPDNEKSMWRKVGSPPVLFDSTAVSLSEYRLTNLLRNKGFLSAKVSSKIYNKKKKKKTKVHYSLYAGELFHFGEIGYQLEDEKLMNLMQNAPRNRFLRKGKPFSYAVMNAERERIVVMAKSLGYFLFSENHVYIEATKGEKKKSFDIVFRIKSKEKLVERDKIFIPHIVKTVTLFPDYNIYQDGKMEDSVISIHQGVVSIYQNNPRYRKGTLEPLSIIRPNEVYSVKKEEQTYLHLQGLRQFSNRQIVYRRQGDSLLDCKIHLVPTDRQDVGGGIEGTNVAGDWGASVTTSYTHRNIFRGAEVFDTRLWLAFERGRVVGGDAYFNTWEYGGEMGLEFHNSVVPFVKRRGNVRPSLKLTTSYSSQERPDYTRSQIRFNLSQAFYIGNNKFLNISLADIVRIYVPAITDNFLNNLISRLVFASYQDQLIVASSISWRVATGNPLNNKDYESLEVSFEGAGNFLSLLAPILKLSRQKDVVTNDFTHSYYSLQGIPFAQYIRTEFNYTFSRAIAFSSANFVSHVRGGVVYAYGNSYYAPFAKQFYSGGAMGVRGWQVRSLGPGTAESPTGTFAEQLGDVLLEFSMELRFPLVWKLEGAVFMDAGNIWYLPSNRLVPEEISFRYDRFFKELAFSPGYGIRWLLSSSIIFRFDMGFKLRTNTGKWNPINTWLDRDNYSWHLSLSYPF